MSSDFQRMWFFDNMLKASKVGACFPQFFPNVPCGSDVSLQFSDRPHWAGWRERLQESVVVPHHMGFTNGFPAHFPAANTRQYAPMIVWNVGGNLSSCGGKSLPEGRYLLLCGVHGNGVRMDWRKGCISHPRKIDMNCRRFIHIVGMPHLWRLCESVFDKPEGETRRCRPCQIQLFVHCSLRHFGGFPERCWVLPKAVARSQKDAKRDYLWLSQNLDLTFLAMVYLSSYSLKLQCFAILLLCLFCHEVAI